MKILCFILIFLHADNSRGDFCLQGPFPSFPAHSLAPPAGLRWVLLDPWMEVRAMGEEEEDERPPAMMMSCTRSLGSVIYQLYPAFQPPTLVSIWKKKSQSRVFFKISPLALNIPLLNANANVNTNTLIKNMWEENANLLFCNLPQGSLLHRKKK